MPKTNMALLWDESFLWGLMAFRSMGALGLDPHIVTADEVCSGGLDGFDVLAVPGGWASDKTVRLDTEGADAVRSFVNSGGGYLGLCGGAGLALDVEGGLRLTHVSRVPTKNRVPSFSGGINLVPGSADHPMWVGVRPPYTFHAWWPGQFHIGDDDGIEVVASYGRPGRDFCLADLPAADLEAHGAGWEKWEDAYGINLDPSRLTGEPAILETAFGRGKVFLSYLHLETPGSKKGNRALVNLALYLGPKSGKGASSGTGAGARSRKTYHAGPDASGAAEGMLAEARSFYRFGRRNFLWYWRNGWILQWRRGVRGVEYSMLHGMISEVAVRLRQSQRSADPELGEKLAWLAGRVPAFYDDARTLLMKERFFLMQGNMSTIKADDPEVTRLRGRLFSGSKRLGGEFKAIIDRLDEVVLALLRS